MKKLVVLLVALALVVGGLPPAGPQGTEASTIRILIDGEPMTLQVAPVIRSGRVLVPFRALFEAFGATVGWQEATETVTGRFGTTSISLRLNRPEAVVNGRTVLLDVAPIALEGRTLVPLRFVAENLGATVRWIERTQTVVVVRAAQRLTVALVSDPMGSRWAFFGRVGPYNTAGMFESLVGLNEDMTIFPRLATSWERVGEKSWRFHLRRDVRFHSGRVFDATSAKESLDAFLTTIGMPFLEIESVEVQDANTLLIHNRIPFPAFVEQMAHPLVAMANIGLTNAQGVIIPDGTGPFKYLSHIDGQELTLVRNDAYWGEQAILEQIRFRIIPDHTTRMLALQTGEVDIAIRVPMPDVAGLQANRNFVVHQINPPMVRHLSFNLWRAPVNDVRVRQAISHAIDRKAIIDGILLGIGGAYAPNFITPLMPWSIFGQTPGYAFNVARSRALLTEAGWGTIGADGIRTRDGVRLQVNLFASSTAAMGRQITEAVQHMMRAVGIDMRITVLEPAAYFTATDRGDHHIALVHNIIATGTGEILLRRAHRLDTSNAITNVTWMGDRVDMLIEIATGTFNQEARFQLYRQIQWEYHNQAVLAPINFMIEYDASGAYVRDYLTHSSLWSQRFDTTYLVRRR